jgi:cytidyltransferase-like protein
MEEPRFITGRHRLTRDSAQHVSGRQRPRDVVVSGAFDDLRSEDVRFLQEAARLGALHVQMWSDGMVTRLTGSPPEFLQEERWYLLQAIRYVSHLSLVEELTSPDALNLDGDAAPEVWAVREAEVTDAKARFCAAHGIELHVIDDDALAGFPMPPVEASEHEKVIVTGCYDWLHSGHVRFFEEVSELGDLYVAVGNDANVRLLKGAGHPMLSEDERTYMVASVRYVTQAVVTKGMGWMDAAPNVDEIRPDIYAVNEDGDKPEKAAFCAERGLRYVVLKREPKEGLERRSSTALRGF